MATLMSLPNEILLEIINVFVPPDDLVNFCRICTHIKCLAEDRLKEHRRRLTDCSYISVGEISDWEISTTHFSTSFGVLRHLWENVDAVYYLRKLSNNAKWPPVHAHLGVESPIGEQVEQVVKDMEGCNFKGLLDICSWLDAETREEWHRQLDYGEEATALALVLALSRSISEVRIYTELSYYKDALGPLLKSAAQQPSIRDSPLSRVKVLYIAYNTRVSCEEVFDLLTRLLLLPALTSFCGIIRFLGRVFEPYMRATNLFKYRSSLAVLEIFLRSIDSVDLESIAVHMEFPHASDCEDTISHVTFHSMHVNTRKKMISDYVARRFSQEMVQRLNRKKQIELVSLTA